MKTTTQGILFGIVANLAIASASFGVGGVGGLNIAVQNTNAVLKWTSSAGNLFLVESESNLTDRVNGFPWTQVTNYFPASQGTNLTTFVDPNPVVYPTNSWTGTNSGGGGGVPMPGGTNSGGGGGTNIVNSSNARFYTVYNVTPSAGQPIFGVAQDSSANQLNIFQNAFDPNDDFLFVSSLTQPSHGSITYTADGSTFQYTPSSGFYGVDSFSFSIINQHQGSSSGLGKIFVTQTGDAGITVNDLTFILPTNVYLTTFNAITNSSSPSATLFAVTTPRYGSITTNTTGNITYTRNPSYYGNDSFAYVVTDGTGGYATGNVQVQQVSTAGNGLPDQWQLAYGMDPTQDNSQADPDGDGLPNIAEFMLGTDPLRSDNPLNLPTIPNGTVLSNYAQIPLVGVSGAVPAPPVTLFENGIPAPNTSLAQGPDGVWSINWDTSHLSNGLYTIQVAMQYGHNSSGPVLYGTEKNVVISNAMTFDSLTSQFTSYGLIIDATLNGITNANVLVQLYDDYGNPLVYGNFAVTNGQVDVYWDLTDGYGDQLSFGNIQAVFTVTDEDVDPPPFQVPHWWYREGSGGGPGFVVAWGWDVNFYQFNNNQNNMIENGVINILANPSDINAYTMAPCCIWNMPYSSAATFRYDSDTDKRILTNALAGNNYFFWLGHGNWNTILGNADHSNISAREVQDALGNLLPQATPKHPKTNSHPYKLVVINGCQTDGDLWPRSFGIDYDPPGTTNYVPWYQATGRSPRAFIGWTKENYAPGAGDFTGLAHAEFGDALGALWSDWMRGFPLNLCIEDFTNSAIQNGFAGQDSYHISGCVDLQRGE
jgi:hypothetical protein